MSISEKLDTITENFSKVYEAGKKSEYDEFWDNYTGKSGTGKDWRRKFANPSWTDDIFKPPFTKITATQYAGSMFQTSGINEGLKQLTEIDVSATDSSTSNMSSFANSSAATYYPIMKFPPGSSLNLTFGYNANLVTIEKLVVDEAMSFPTTFISCNKLANITFEGVIGKSINFQWCPLTRESITNIVAHLSPTVSDQTVTFKKSAKEAAFTDDEWATLISTKPNWTFSLL